MINSTHLPNVLVGMNTPYIHHDTLISKELELLWSPEWTSRPSAITGSILDPKNFVRSQTSIFLESNDQTKFELSKDYANKSMMSLDGIFSPISFYPTPYSSTFHITKYPTPNCPFCFGTKTYRYSLIADGPQGLASAISQITTFSLGAQQLSNFVQERSRPCPFCESTEEKNKKLLTMVSNSEVLPPYIIASGDDLTIISNISHTGLTGIPIINYSTLNPIVLSSGEFSNYQNKQSGDYCGHTIDLVAFGMTVPREGDGLRHSFNRRIERSFFDYDLNLIDRRDNFISNGIQIPEMPRIANNMRFFGLRGPVMLHSWGYDTEGYPVPNSSGEPLINGLTLVRDENNNILGKNQKLVSGVWTKPYKENSFYKGWAQQPGSWPVGPIDFRWDDNAGVWTIGANYKLVHVIIEEDLVDTNPSRGSIVESAYDNNPLPSGLRKLVFVKDILGVYSAPRGAALYCKYNADNGFYEPVGHKPFITSGTISSYNTVNIYKVYTLPESSNLSLSDAPNVETYRTTYKNPLGYQVSINSVGLFTFIDGSWVLQSYNAP